MDYLNIMSRELTVRRHSIVQDVLLIKAKSH